MKKANKALLLVLCAILLVAGSVMGTLAYLTSTAKVENTFTVGNVTITLDEAKVTEYGVKDGETRVATNEYKLIPGHTYVKDPTVHVAADSEDCYIFVKVENGLGTAGTITMETGWTLVNDTDNVWMYNEVQSAGESVVAFEEFIFGTDANPSQYTDAKIVVTAYAIQADTLTGKTPAEIWALFN